MKLNNIIAHIFKQNIGYNLIFFVCKEDKSEAIILYIFLYVRGISVPSTVGGYHSSNYYNFHIILIDDNIMKVWECTMN